MNGEISEFGLLIEQLLQFPTLVGLVGSWVFTQMSKFALPVHWDHYKRRARTMYTAFLSGWVVTVLAHMIPPDGSTEWIVTPPFSSVLAGMVVGGISPYAWDLFIEKIVEKLSPRLARKLSGKVSVECYELEDGRVLTLITGASNEILKIREEVDGDDNTIYTQPNAVEGEPG